MPVAASRQEVAAFHPFLPSGGKSAPAAPAYRFPKHSQGLNLLCQECFLVSPPHIPQRNGVCKGRLPPKGAALFSCVGLTDRPLSAHRCYRAHVLFDPLRPFA